MEFIRRDLEGSDTETRRRAASDLIRGLLEHFAQDVTKICSEFIQEYLQEYERDKAKNWRAKDSAMYLLTALSAKALTVQVFFLRNIQSPLKSLISDMSSMELRKQTNLWIFCPFSVNKLSRTYRVLWMGL